MKCILLNTNLHSGGAERQLLQILQQWCTAGRDSSLLLLERQGVWLNERPLPYIRERVHYLSDSAPQTVVSKVWWAVRTIGRLRTFLGQHPHDVVIGFLWLPVFLSALALFFLKRRPVLVWSVQSDLYKHLNKTLLRRIVRQLISVVFSISVEHFVAVSPGIQRTTMKLLGISSNRFTLIPNSIDRAFIRERSAISFGILAKRAVYRLVSVGRLHYAKGTDVLIRALALTLSRGIDLEVCIVGDGEERGTLEGLVRSLPGLDSRVYFVGYSSNPYAWIASADVVVSSSRWETFGIAIAESMALGLPVVATETDGALYLISDKLNGLLVPIDDARTLSVKIEEVIMNSTMNKRIRSEAQRRVASLDVSSVATRYFELVHQLARSSS